jgi:hypothetical protein
MTPPPLNVIAVCEERSFGLSMILKRSATLKYNNSITKSAANINMYVILYILYEKNYEHMSLQI